MRLYSVSAFINGQRHRMIVNARNRGHAVDQFIEWLLPQQGWIIGMDGAEVEAL